VLSLVIGSGKVFLVIEVVVKVCLVVKFGDKVLWD